MSLPSQGQSPKTPFEGMDLTWINGQSRYAPSALTFKSPKSGASAMATCYWDQYYLFSLHRPQDATFASSATMGRHGEFITNLVSLGLEYSDEKITGRLALQAGNMLNLIQFPDPTLLGGGNTSGPSLGIIREAVVGFKWPKKYGLLVEAGIFPGFIGLEGYLTQENWNYQRSFLSEMTPFYSSGLKVQYHPGMKTRLEFWLVNGWQSYHRWHNGLGTGGYFCHRPTENLQIQATAYHGWDTPEALRRMHHDHSIVWRYKSSGKIKSALSLNNHIGFQAGTGVSHREQHFYGSSLAHRTWLPGGKMAISARIEHVIHQGTYLLISPSPVTPNSFTRALDADPQQAWNQSMATLTFDILPLPNAVIRFEYNFRRCNIPYYAGPGGTISSNGWVSPNPGNWEPDLRKTEHSLSVSLGLRL